MVDKRLLAVIPARSGSKRIPNKNIIDFCGKPMIAWTIEAANKSGLFSDVVVSTDSNEIAEIAKQYGASVPFLREAYSDDHSPISLATLDAVEYLEALGKTYDTVIQLMANCPLRNADDIVAAYENFNSKALDFQISCFKFGWMNPWWAMKLDSEARPSACFPGALKQRSQDLDPLYCPTGAIWLADVLKFKLAKTFYGSDYRFCQLSWRSALDIDDSDDYTMAESLQLNFYKGELGD